MIIVTGAAGFIGSCLVATLNAAGRSDLLLVDDLGTGAKWKNLADRTFLDIIGIDEFREQVIMDAFDDNIEAVIHLGACSTTTETNVDYLYENNVRYSMDVALWALEREARFIYASSAATYGDGSRGYDDRTADLRPLNPYGWSKHRFDLWVRSEGLDAQCVGLKFFNVFGPNEYHKGDMASMVYKATGQILEHGGVKLFRSTDLRFGDGGQQRDFVYVKDCCAIMMQLLAQPDVNGIFNLGTGQARSWNDLMHSVFAALGLPTQIEYIDMPPALSKQYQNFTQADMSALRAVMPNLAFASLEESVADYVQGYLLKDWQNW
jgi:ADP-L-glycero-D-manno-heptose 6-epimerase